MNSVMGHMQTMQLQRCRCARVWGLQRNRRTERASRGFVLHSAKASELIAEGNLRYRSGDRVTALSYYEQALQEPELTIRQKQIALHGATCVHASFGEVEAAQSVLRQAFLAGLDWEDAIVDPELVQPKTSLQISLQLKKFNQQLQQQSTSLKPKNPSWSTLEAVTSTSLTEDISNMLGSSTSDTLELDASPLGIAKRTAGVLGALVVLGIVLFYSGLLLFPLDQSINTENLELYTTGATTTEQTAVGADELAY